MGNKSNSTNFIKQGSILAVASVVSRIIGLLYRSPMTHIIGEESNGLYCYAFDVYSFALTLSSYSMPLAVSKLISGKFASKEFRNGFNIFKLSMLLATALGFLMMLIIFFSAPAIERFSKYDGLTIPLRILAPTIFVVAIAGTLRGFFQSRKTMIPTAVSQVLEQIINAVVSVLAALIMVKASNENNRAGMGAGGGTLGTLFGAISAVCFLGFVYYIYRGRMQAMLEHDCNAPTDSTADIMKMLAVTILPIILSQAVYQASGIIDGTLFGRFYLGEDKKALVSINSKYRTLINVPNAISSAMASSMIPTLVSLRAVGNHNGFRDKLATAVKVNMVIAVPCAVGLSVLGIPIMRMLYPTTDYIQSGTLLMWGGVAVIFYALSTITNAALQGLDKMNLPVIHSSISLGIHIILVLLLLKFTRLGVYALLIGTVTYPLVVCILNWVSVNRYAEYKQEIKNTFLMPLAASAIMGVVAYFLFKLGTLIFKTSYFGNFVAALISIVIAIIVYFAALFLLKGLTHEDMCNFPMGLRIERVAKKFRLMK